MKKITKELLNTQEDYLLYIHTPFCGTCHVARSFLAEIEKTHKQDIFYEMNAGYFKEFMQEEQIESVPCLLIKQAGVVQEKVYTFHSIGNIYHYLINYTPDLFHEK